MKWFKHISDSLDDPFIFDLISEFGGDGYMVFFGILEILARECDGDFTKFQTFSAKFLSRKLQLSTRKLSKVLDFIKIKGRFLIATQGKQILINCPKLQELQDDYSRKKRLKCPDTSRTNYPLEVEVDKDIPPIVPQRDGEGSIKKSDWNAFCKHFLIDRTLLTPDLTDEVIAHLLSVLREQSRGAKIRVPLSVAKKRAEEGEADRQDKRTVQAWLHPPPSETECHCGGELEKRFAPGSGETSFICLECGRAYPKR